MSVFDRIDRLWPLLTIFDHFWPFLSFFVIFWPYWLFWLNITHVLEGQLFLTKLMVFDHFNLFFFFFFTVFDRIEHCGPLLTVVDRFWPILNFLKTFYVRFWPYWPSLTIVDHFWPFLAVFVIFCHFLTILTFLAEYHTRTRGPIVSCIGNFFTKIL